MTSTVRPGEIVKINLGLDKTIKIDTMAVFPKHSGREEEKSSWFERDSKKFRSRTEERVTTLSNTNFEKTEPAFVIIVENLPVSTEEKDIKVELLFPSVKSIRALHLDASINDIDAKLGKKGSEEGKEKKEKWSFFTQDSWNKVKKV